MARGPSLQAISAGVLAAVVGFASSFAVTLEGLAAVGASQAEAASGLMALSIAMGLCALILSLATKMPISVAWSTPGAALLATAGPPEGGFAAAAGAFVACGFLIILSGLWRPLGRWVSSIPSPLANALLAGVLFGLCLAPVRAVAEMPWAALAIIVTWAAVARVKRLLAVPAAVAVTAVLVIVTSPVTLGDLGHLGPVPVFVAPEFSPAALIGIALPLFIVTMASQNIPGFAVLNANGYHPPAGPVLAATGGFTLAAAPLGGHAVNLAAITAALTAGQEADPDPARRYWAAVVTGAVYVIFGLSAGVLTAFFSASPPVLITAVAGLALLGPFASSLSAATADPRDREAAIVTFVVTASSLNFFGISGAFWGLLAGGAVYGLSRLRRGESKV